MKELLRSCRMLLLCLCLPAMAMAQHAEWQQMDTKTDASFRGLSVVDGSVAWVSGSNGWVGMTTDGGAHWRFAQVKDHERCDFRTCYAFDKKNAVIANAGAPAYILRTSDGGATWQKVYENKDTAAFIDGADFWDTQRGIIYGDPINGRMLVLSTNDGGRSWTELPEAGRPLLIDGESSFAASGTCIKCLPGNTVVIATGGKVSRLHTSADGGRSWQAAATPILQGASTTGTFTFLALNSKQWLIAGGDYKNDTLRTANLFLSRDAGKTWQHPASTTGGYRECLAVIGGHMLVAAGPGGLDISTDDGNNWEPLSAEKQYHVIKKSRHGNLLVIAGGGGKLAILKIK